MERSWNIWNVEETYGDGRPQLVTLRRWKRALKKALAVHLIAFPILTKATVIIKSLCFDELKPTIKGYRESSATKVSTNDCYVASRKAPIRWLLQVLSILLDCCGLHLVTVPILLYLVCSIGAPRRLPSNS
ncbi:hypothetical protein N7G274_005110 [Stereocaulon virgatum]|uniref:Uncharacterized protein n=1 Tax=Stereocaulon virgatum TaxID=373712 RepID=A0ABR4A7N7_9LECA